MYNNVQYFVYILARHILRHTNSCELLNILSRKQAVWDSMSLLLDVEESTTWIHKAIVVYNVGSSTSLVGSSMVAPQLVSLIKYLAIRKNYYASICIQMLKWIQNIDYYYT